MHGLVCLVHQALKQAALFAISNLTFYKQRILQCLQRFDFKFLLQVLEIKITQLLFVVSLS